MQSRPCVTFRRADDGRDVYAALDIATAPTGSDVAVAVWQDRDTKGALSYLPTVEGTRVQCMAAAALILRPQGLVAAYGGKTHDGRHILSVYRP